MIGANVIIEGTELGAPTDEKGDYAVLYVPAGTYAVMASYLGYDPFTYTSVVVNADQTTVLNFRLRPTIIQVEGVTSIAVREPIVVSQTQTSRSVTSQDIGRLPVTTINQVITLQAGVVQSNLGTHLRGGRNEEITYFVDGIVTKVPQTGVVSADMSPSAIEEVSVISGGFDAEYGDALSGIVNVVTREGGSKPSGSLRYLTDQFLVSDKLDKLNYGYSLYDVSLGGPLPLTSRLRYFLSGEFMMTESYQPALYKVKSPRQEYRGNARLTYMLPNAKGKVTGSAYNSREQWVIYGPFNDPKMKYFESVPMSRQKNTIGSMTFNYMLSARTLTSLRLGYTSFQQLYGTRDYAWETENDRQWFQDYRMKAEHLIDYLKNHSLPAREVIVDSVMQYHEEYTDRDVSALRNNPYGIEGIFYTYGDFRVWRYWANKDLQGRFDITHSVGKIHEFKTGCDMIKYDMCYYDNNLPWVSNPFWDYYERSPIKFAAYVQDKMDFEGLIARVGLRMDYFDPKTYTYGDPGNFLNDSLAWASDNFKVSPRLGFSLPVTERMKFRFNYGHYFQLPVLQNLYMVTDTAVVRIALTRGNTTIGNIFIKPQKTVMYEFGLENQFSDILVFGFTTYFKDVYDLSQIRQVPALPITYFQFFNVDYGNIKGFEFRVDKIMSNMWALGLSYTLQFAKGTASFAGEFYNDYYLWQIDPPVIDYWLDFDERHLVNANFDIQLPKDFILIPLQNVTNSIVFSFNSGAPYTPTNQRGDRIGDENSARMPGSWNVDWNASKQVPVGPVNLGLNMIIQNLFNTRQVVTVYQTTGKPDDNGDPEPSLDQFGPLTLTTTRYSPQSDFNHDGMVSATEMKTSYIAARDDFYNNPVNYGSPFRIQLGASIGF